MTELLEPARTALAEAQGKARALQAEFGTRKPSDAERLQYAGLLLKLGKPEEAAAALDNLASLEANVLRARALLATAEYRRAGPLIAELERTGRDDRGVQEVLFEWWVLSDDLARIEQAASAGAAPPQAAESQLTRAFSAADLKLRLLDYAGAYADYSRISERKDLGAADRARVLRGRGASLYHLQRYDEALGSYVEALVLSPLDPAVMSGMADSLLRLGRIDDAIEVLNSTLELAPRNLRSHQLLGSGFTKLNYSQLWRSFPASFADERGKRALRKAEAARETGRAERAREMFLAIAKQHPEWADIQAGLGSLEYGLGNFAAARDYFWHAWHLRPEYGRVHDGYARSVEALRLEVTVHRAADEAAFAAETMPQLRDIERFVLNWRSLAPRHQKRLALSIQPWARYLPALIEGGATFYVKPLHQLLSEAPNQSYLRDQRIDYDSRLWDDVRGVGGFHSVVGIQDLEERIDSGYDTALHELTHQVHMILAPQWQRQIQTMFAETTRRQAAEGNAFLSSYAASSLWEYFAEGANSLHTPRRDRFDTREIVLERLQQRDPALLKFVQYIMQEADVAPSFVMALVAAGEHQLSVGKAREAEAIFRRALKRDPTNEKALTQRAFALSALGKLKEAEQAAVAAHGAHPESAAAVVQLAQVEWLRGGPLSEIIASLEASRAGVSKDEQYLVDLQMGELSLYIGDTAAARRAFSQVTAVQPTEAQALAGRAAAEALDDKWADAWPLYDRTVQIRAGDIGYRVRYARDLIRAHEFARAAQQISAALLLDPESPDAIALQAWQLLIQGRAAEGRDVAARAHEMGSWSTLATIVLAAAERQLGNEERSAEILAPLRQRMRSNAPPRYLYMAKSGRYELVETLSAVDRLLLQSTALVPDTGAAKTPDPKQ